MGRKGIVTGFRLLAVCGWVLLISACGETEVCDNGIDDDNNGAIDCADEACASVCTSDGGKDAAGDSSVDASLDQAIDRMADQAADLSEPDLFILPDLGLSTAQQSIINSIALPQSNADFARDYDGSGAKNALGELLSNSAIQALGNIQQSFTASINDGSVILLLELFAADLANAAQAIVKTYIGEDLDANAADNFSGSEPFQIAASSPMHTGVSGMLIGGAYQGEGALVFVVPLGTTPTSVVLSRARVTGTITGGGWTNGQITGLLSSGQIEDVILPAVEALIIGLDQAGQLSPVVKFLLDANGNGTIEAGEVVASTLIRGLFAPDVDMDGDGRPDAFSVGMGFGAVGATIQ